MATHERLSDRNQTRTTRQLIFELRNGAGIPLKHVDKISGEWREVDANDRLVMKDYGERLDAERRRKRDAILQILFDEAAAGHCYTANQFAEAFEGKAGLGGERTIRERISALSTQGYIKHFRNAADYGLPSSGRTKFGYLCVEGTLVESMLLLRREDFDELLDRAAERGAERALSHLGLESSHAARDIHELRDLLEAWRDARRTAWQTVIKVITTGILAALLVGAAIKLKLMGGSQ